MIKKSVFLLVLGFVSMLALAQETGYKAVAHAEQATADLNNMASKLSSIQSDFVQEKHMEFLDVTVTSKGKFWFNRPNKLRWEYVDPFNYVIVINNGKITISDNGQNSEFKVKGNKIFEQINYVIVNSLSGKIDGDDKYDVSLFENADSYLVKMLPKAEDVKEVLNEMNMYISKPDLSVYKIKMVESTSDYNIITFNNRKLNESIPDHVFIID